MGVAAGRDTGAGDVAERGSGSELDAVSRTGSDVSDEQVTWD